MIYSFNCLFDHNCDDKTNPCRGSSQTQNVGDGGWVGGRESFPNKFRTVWKGWQAPYQQSVLGQQKCWLLWNEKTVQAIDCNSCNNQSSTSKQNISMHFNNYGHLRTSSSVGRKCTSTSITTHLLSHTSPLFRSVLKRFICKFVKWVCQ